MDSLERLKKIFAGELPDRVPIYELTINPKVIDALNPGMSYYDFIDYWDYDAAGPNMTWDSLGRIKWLDESKRVFIDRWGVTRQFLNDLLPVPIEAPIQSPTDLVHYNPPNPEEEPLLEKLGELVSRFKGRKATFILGRDVWTGSYMVRGMENLLIDMLTEPEMVRDIVRMQIDYYKVVHKKAIEMGIDIIHLVDDYAYHSGPLMSPDLFEEFLAPGFKEIVMDIKVHGAYCMKHTDGDIHKILPFIVEAGIDGLGPLEIGASMVLSEVKKIYPHITVMGNVSCDLLSVGTEYDIEKNVRDLINTTAAGGHYILSSDNSIPYSTCPGNLKTMIDTARKYGAYFQEKNR
jgi:uroporphyrinogen decarboxylase